MAADGMRIALQVSMPSLVVDARGRTMEAIRDDWDELLKQVWPDMDQMGVANPFLLWGNDTNNISINASQNDLLVLEVKREKLTAFLNILHDIGVRFVCCMRTVSNPPSLYYFVFCGRRASKLYIDINRLMEDTAQVVDDLILSEMDYHFCPGVPDLVDDNRFAGNRFRSSGGLDIIYDHLSFVPWIPHAFMNS